MKILDVINQVMQTGSGVILTFEVRSYAVVIEIREILAIEARNPIANTNTGVNLTIGLRNHTTGAER